MLASILSGIFKTALVIAIILTPAAIDYALDRILANTLPPTICGH